MKKLTFKVQLYLSLGIFFGCFILATVTKHGFFCNIGWIIYGLFYVLHPVWPESWDYRDHSKLQLGCRIAGVLAIVIGIITRFGV